MITYIKGDLLKTDCEVIAHGCNCRLSMKSGVAKVITKKFSKVRAADNTFMGGYATRDKLGEVDFVNVNSKKIKIVANCYTQYDYNRHSKPLDYDALDICLEKLKEFVVENDYTLALPKIGCGLAGGSWSRVEKMINDIFGDIEVKVYVL